MNRIHHINPDTLVKNPAFSQIIVAQGQGKTIYIGGQDAVDKSGRIVGKGELQAQTRQVMENIQNALSACGASFDNLVKLGIHVVQGQDALLAFQASAPYLEKAAEPPAITVVYVAGLANPDFLIEIDATAFLPD